MKISIFFAVILVFPLGLRSSKYVIMWQYGWGKLSPVWEWKWNGGRKILTSAQPPQRRPHHKLDCCDIRRRSWNSQEDGCWAPQISEEVNAAAFIHFELFGFSTFCSSYGGGTFPESTNVLPDLCTFLPNLLSGVEACTFGGVSPSFPGFQQIPSAQVVPAIE